ncbi:MAG: GH25 family lysozyme [Ginsengibacter sp.]
MARKKKRSSSTYFIRIIFWLTLTCVACYYTVIYLTDSSDIFYPGFQIEIPRGYAIHGIDVSKYQSTINWKEVKNMDVQGIRIGFAFIKATEGVGNVDNQFRRNWLKAEEQNICKGAYHFFIAGKSGRRQAANFIEIVNLKKGDLPPVLDIEKAYGVSAIEIKKEVAEWLSVVGKYYNVQPVIYTNIDFYNRYLQNDFDTFPVWIAHYLQPVKPRIEHKWFFWQHSESGRVNGIKAPVDFNVFYGDSSDFKNFLIQ